MTQYSKMREKLLSQVLFSLSFLALFSEAWGDGPWLLKNASTVGDRVDHLYKVIFALTTVMFFLTQGALLYFIIRYRARKGVSAYYFPEQQTLELAWWVVPGVILLFLALYQWNTWAMVKTKFPDKGAFKIEALAQQFAWNFRYPGKDGKFATADDFISAGELYVPAQVPVLLQLRSQDVIHSFYVPQFRIKQDVVPGLTVKLWFEVKAPGTYELACAELCGMLHYAMSGKVIALPQKEFARWLKKQYRTESEPLDWGWEWEEDE